MYRYQYPYFNATNLIGQSILSARKRTWSEYQEDAAERIAMLQGDWLDILKEWIRQHVDKDGWEQVYAHRYAFHTSTNIMADVVNKVSKLYLDPPKRQFIDENGNPCEVYDEIIDNIAFKLNKIMNESLRITLACGGCIIRPFLNRVGEWAFNVITPDMFSPIADDAEPDKIVGLIYVFTSRDNQDEYTIDTYEVCIADPQQPYYLHLDKDGKEVERKEGVEYPFWKPDGTPYLPYVLARVNNESNELINKTVGLDLYYATLMCGAYAVYKEWLIRNQSHKQWSLVGPGVDEIGNQVLDPTIPIIIPKGEKSEVEIQVHDLASDPKYFDNAIDKELEREAGKRGYSLNDFIPSAQKSTAEALTIQNEARNDYVKSLELEFSHVEAELADVMRLIWNQYGDGSIINEEAKFSIKYKKQSDDRILVNYDAYAKMVADGILKKSDLLMLFNPNMSQDEADSYLADTAKTIPKVENNDSFSKEIGGPEYAQPK